MAYIFARTERKLDLCCKIKDNDLNDEEALLFLRYIILNN